VAGQEKIIVEYIVLGVSLANLRQIPLKKFPTRQEAEDFIKNFKDFSSLWERLDEKSLVIVEKQKPQHIPTIQKEEFKGNPLLPNGKRKIG